MDNLIENIAYKSTDGNVVNENFDPTLLEGKFRQAMSILQVNTIHIIFCFIVKILFYSRIIKFKLNKI